MSTDPRGLEPDPEWVAHQDDDGDELSVPEARSRLRIAAPERERPEIRIGTDIAAMSDAASAALTSDPVTYQRGGALVHVIQVASETRGVRLPVGSPMIRNMAIATLRERLSHCGRWIRYDGRSERYKDVTPDERAVAATHARGSWPGVRVLVGVTETPTLRADGTVSQEAGYDSATGYVYAPNSQYPAIADKPSRDEACAALALLREVYADFPFVHEADRSVPLAAILTVLARPAIDGSIPVSVFEASMKGSGKTLLADTVTMITTGRDAARTTYPTDPDELRKVLDGFALEGARVVVIDNVPTSQPLGGGALDAYVTARDSVSIRELGRTGNRELPWRAALLATGNNVHYSGDTIRRVLVARLEPTTESPETRADFRHHPLFEYVRAERPMLVAAALTILRAYVAAGKPDMGTSTWGSFAEWAALIPPALVFAGGADPMGARPSGDGEHDPEASAVEMILASLPRLDHEGRGITARELVALLYPNGKPPTEQGPPDGNDELRDAIEFLSPARGGYAPDTKVLGNRLRGAKGRVIGGRRLVAVPGRAGVLRWRVDVIAAR